MQSRSSFGYSQGCYTREEYDEHEKFITINRGNVNILNEWASTPNKAINLMVLPCKNDTSRTKCASQQVIDQTLDEVLLNLYFPDYYVDLEDFKTSLKPYLI